MAVNVSPLQLSNPKFADAVAGALQRHGLPPRELELEITESHAIPDAAVVDQTLHSVAALGVHLAMDDFGMGHSSLLHLRHFPLQALKMDGSITRDVCSNGASVDIIRAAVDLGRSQRIEIVAEFVETQGQEQCLKDLGCNLLQGYLHSPPLPAAQCAAFIRKRGVAVRQAARVALADVASHALHHGSARQEATVCA